MRISVALPCENITLLAFKEVFLVLLKRENKSQIKGKQ